jgi:hypothetical protein
VRHFAAPQFWASYRRLPANVQRNADKAFLLLKSDDRHPSLQLKKLDGFWSARVGLHHRVLAKKIEGGLLWFWIGTHAEYDAIVGDN